jgi:DNA-binding CsgD family transcriptional regulator
VDQQTHNGLYLLVSRYALRHMLSGRETSVLELAAVGLHRKEVSSRLGCSPGTVDTYWRRIFRKTNRGSECAVLADVLAFAVTHVGNHA